MPRELLAQFRPVEEALAAAGFAVWPMVEYEADDGLAAAAAMAAADERVERVIICTPDKDLGQCVGGKVVQWDRRQDKWFDVDGVRAKFGIAAASIPDLLALVGDTRRRFPGLTGWGAKSAATVLARYGHLEAIPPAADDWDVGVRNAGTLARVLREEFPLALLFRRIATVDVDAPVSATVDELAWSGPRAEMEALSKRIDAAALLKCTPPPSCCVGELTIGPRGPVHVRSRAGRGSKSGSPR